MAADRPAAMVRDPACVERWPECEDGAYNPNCCRFPKSCSCTIRRDATPSDAAFSGDYCPGCGRSEYAGITHVCPPLEGTWPTTTEATRTVSTIPVFFDTDIATVTMGGETSV